MNYPVCLQQGSSFSGGNTVKPDNSSYYQADVARGYTNQNKALKNMSKKPTVGWFAQDLVTEFSRVDNYYKRGIYEQMLKFPKRLRFGMITGETKIAYEDATKSKNTRISNEEIVPKILDFTKQYEITNLVFVSKVNSELYREKIRNSKPGDYPFIPNTTSDLKGFCFIVNKATGGRLRLEDDQGEISILGRHEISDDLKWNIVFDDNEVSKKGFQLLNQKSGEIIRYVSSGALAGKVIKESDTSIKWKTSFWRIVSTTSGDGSFYLENCGSKKLLSYDGVNGFSQTEIKDSKSEWLLEMVKSSVKQVGKRIISSLGQDKTISIYPNPGSETISINRNNETPVFIYGMNGELVKSFTKNQELLDVRTLNKGVYFIKVGNQITKFLKD